MIVKNLLVIVNIAIVIIALVIIQYSFNYFYLKPIVFEDFNTSEEAKQELLRRYTYGPKYSQPKDDSIEAGAECQIISKKHSDLTKYPTNIEMLKCSYYTGIFSLKP